AYKEILREGIVEHAPTGSHHRLAFAGDVPGQSDSRRKVVEVPIVQMIEPAGADKPQAVRWIEVAQQAMLLANLAEVVVADSEIDREIAAPSNAVLNITGV